jgi:predicted RNase H-like nuclease (RuvC/YqgF family)
MPTLDEDVEALERRVSEWEGQLGFFVPIVRQLHREILATQEHVQRLDSRVERLENRVERLENRVERLEDKVDRGFASMLDKFRDVDEKLVKVQGSLDALPRVLAEEIARRRGDGATAEYERGVPHRSDPPVTNPRALIITTSVHASSVGGT